MIDRQGQEVGEGGTGMQAGRDLIVTGLSPSEVGSLCAAYLEANFPRLQQEARREAEQQVRYFGELLHKRLVDDAAKIVVEKLAVPDVQASINDAVMAVARKGENANPHLLSNLISERLAQTSDEYRDMVIGEAIQVVPKLTAAQIAALSFVHFVSATGFTQLTPDTLHRVEQTLKNLLAHVRLGFDLSHSQKQHLVYAGAWTLNPFVGGDIYEMLAVEGLYAYLKYPHGMAFKEALLAQAPSFVTLLEQFNKEGLVAASLTSVGQAIAIANLAKPLGVLDYKIWLR